MSLIVLAGYGISNVHAGGTCSKGECTPAEIERAQANRTQSRANLKAKAKAFNLSIVGRDHSQAEQDKLESDYIEADRKHAKAVHAATKATNPSMNASQVSKKAHEDYLAERTEVSDEAIEEYKQETMQRLLAEREEGIKKTRAGGGNIGAQASQALQKLRAAVGDDEEKSSASSQSTGSALKNGSNIMTFGDLHRANKPKEMTPRPKISELTGGHRLGGESPEVESEGVPLLETPADIREKRANRLGGKPSNDGTSPSITKSESDE